MHSVGENRCFLRPIGHQGFGLLDGFEVLKHEECQVKSGLQLYALSLLRMVIAQGAVNNVVVGKPSTKSR